MVVRCCLVVIVSVWWASQALAASPAMVVDVDARELPRRLMHSTLEIPCQAGPLRLWYPKWFPGSHGPHGRVEDVAGFRVETLAGKPIAWQRDDVETHCFIVQVPDGCTSIRVKMDTITESIGADRAGIHTVGNRDLGVFNWNTCVVYPEGIAADTLQVSLRLRLPEGWKFATAMKDEAAKSKAGEIVFLPVSLTTLIDSPLIAGRHVKTFKLDAGAAPAAFLHLTSESAEALNLDPKVVELYSRLVREAWALFGSAPYPEYHFLVVCSDQLGTFGLEHLACSLNGVGERGLLEERLRRGWWIANLLPHEYAHAWCGKYRRPSAMITTDFHTPQKTRLLWVYEGLTEYLGEVLSVRCGLRTTDDYKLTMTNNLRTLSRITGRQWRTLEDTGTAAHLGRNAGPSWNQLRRGQDFYMEGMLLWYECDTIIREKSSGAKTLDDFCKRFFAPVAGKKTVAGYDFADVVRDLNATAEYDWDNFLKRRVATPQEALPLDVVGRLGYRLKYADRPLGGGLPWVDTPTPLADTLGMTIRDGIVTSVDPNFPADKAGFTVGMKVLGVNNRKLTVNRLRDAIADSVTRRQVEFLLEDGEEFRTITVPYADGPRYLQLERHPDKPDVLGEILKPQAK